MEKIKLNNQIVLMRRYVKQAKVHSINKLVKQVKLLQNRKGNEGQIKKAKRKAERFLETIALLKKIKPDNVSKLALSKTRNWKNILQQKNSTLEDRCIAMLASYEAVQKEVETFHNSNEGLVRKISDLIKQWDERYAYSKNSPKNKRNYAEREVADKKLSMNTSRNIKNKKNHSDIIMTNNHTNKEEKTNDICKKGDKQRKLSTELSENTISDISHKYELDSNVDAVETTKKVRESDFDFQKNNIETKKSNTFENQERNHTIIQDSDTSKESELEDVTTIKTTKIRELDFNPLKKIEIRCSNSKKCLENAMEVASSDDDDDEEEEYDESANIGYATQSEQEIKNLESENAMKQLQSCVSEFTKKDNNIHSTDKRLKAIALLNMDELEGIDEIPVENTVVKNQSDKSEGESSEDETFQTSQNKRNDPFFLGCGGEDSINEEKIASMQKKNVYVPKDKHSAFFNSGRASQREKNTFSRHENMNQHSKNFKNISNFSRRDSPKFRNERDNFKPFHKDKFMTRKYQDTFQPKSKRAFDRDDSKNQRDFKRKVNSSEAIQNNTNNVPLHPSWEARRKQKELINKSFQGKRIVFND